MAVSFITVFDTKSNRVKGLAFHPTQPLLLAALHNGLIQLWDYRIKTLIDRFDEHDGPVRGIAFHPNQPLFVSGGDDFKIKVWNYKERRCLFTLTGHLDYIRTVEFHHEYPWILSASDDQTIRIWNWQSRQLIATLTGHSHYVMCARFSPTEDLVVSASLDQTVRVWDIQGLRKKSVIPTHEPDAIKLSNDVFGSSDAVVKYVLEGHDRGVNWASFHPHLPLIVSGADDRTIKLWRMSDTKAWEVDTLRGHYNNVSCCIFHPRADIMLSNGEDKTIRVWDMNKRSLLLTHRREHDRFWILAAHPNRNLFAAGHDSGLIVFKLEKERPAMTVDNREVVYYVKDRYVRACELASGRDIPVLAIRKREFNPRNIQFNRTERAVIVNYEVEGGQYELYAIPKDAKQAEASGEGRRGTGRCALWVSRKNFAVLDKSNTILIKDLQNQTVRTISPSYSVDAIFPAPGGNILLKSDDRLILHDIAQKNDVAECTIPSGTKFVEWSGQDKSALLAVFSKDTIVIFTSKLELMCTINERTRIKSGVWDDNTVFIYTTMSHIKYLLPNGDNGIVRTLDQPIYLTAVRGSKLFCIDREIRPRVVNIDTTEYQFKQALVNKKYGEVLRMVKSANLIGQSIIGYLQQKGFPEVALHFVKDDRTRFDLALECGNIDVALDSAERLDDLECYKRLGREALRQGHYQMVEMAYQKTKDFERLSFLYLITGNIANLKRMQLIAAKRKDVNARFHTALMLGDAAERVRILEEVGQLPLAYLTAKTYGLEEEAQRLREKILEKSKERQSEDEPEPQGIDIAQILHPSPNFKELVPPKPVSELSDEDLNWPLLTMARGPFELHLQQQRHEQSGILAAQAREEQAEEEAAGAGWGDEEEEPKPSGEQEGASGDMEAAETEGGEWDLGDDQDIPKASPAKKSVGFVALPPAGASWPSLWCVNSELPADHVAAGSFETAMQLLTQQIGLANARPMKSHFMRIYTGAAAHLPMQPSTPSSESYLLRNPAAAAQREGLPILAISVSELIERLQVGYRATTAGKFQEALSNFKWILSAIPLVCANTSQELAEVRELLAICKEYCLGIQCELKRKEIVANKGPAQRSAELAAYFTHVNLQPIHLQLALRSAMNICKNLKNWSTAYNFGRRILDLNPKPDVAEKTHDFMRMCEANGLVDEVKLNYDPRNPFVLCGISFEPIYRGSESLQCSYCSAHFLPKHADKVCSICEIGRIGGRGTGLVVVRQNKRPPRAGSAGQRGPQRGGASSQMDDEDYDF